MQAERNGFDRAAMSGFRRTRRLRRSAAMRELVRETTIGPEDFIQPLFVTHGAGVRREIGSMPGQFQFSVDQLPREIAARRAGRSTRTASCSARCGPSSARCRRC
jgi:delta-aminolevulinic acid dehydratase/porphobilinogen synthase